MYFDMSEILVEEEYRDRRERQTLGQTIELYQTEPALSMLQIFQTLEGTPWERLCDYWIFVNFVPSSLSITLSD